MKAAVGTGRRFSFPWRLALGIRLAAAAAGVLAASPALAQLCTWTPPATPATFSNYNPFSAAPNQMAIAVPSVNCTNVNTSPRIGIALGGGTYAARQMTSGTDTLQYNLYTAADYATVWTDNTPRVDVPEGNNLVRIYASIAPGQNVAPGTYTDTVAVKLYTYVPIWDLEWPTSTMNVQIRVTVPAQCTINSGTLAFGSYDPLAASPLDALSQFTLACTRNTAYTVTLGPGSNPLGATRRMANGGTYYLQYEIYKDSGRSVVWNTSNTIGGATPSTSPVTVTAYGRVPAAQIVPAGSYSDSVLSTINF